MPTTSRKIFIDSSILIPFVDRGDPNHRKAVQVIENLARLNYQLYTSFQNISDSFTILAREISNSVALDFIQACLQSNMEILYPQKADLAATYRILKSNRGKQILFREALNAVLMQRKGIMQIITLTFWHNLFGISVSNLTPK